MRSIVGELWLTFTEPLEGGVPCFYNDKYGYTTIAYGNLVDPMSLAINLPMMHPGGTRATTQEIASAWQAVHNDPAAARLGWKYARGLSKLRLTAQGMSDLAHTKIRANNAQLVKLCPDFEEWNACAQMGFHSWAWACGAGAYFPKFVSALRARDFDAAAIHGHINTDGPDRIPNTDDDNRGVIARNVANRILFLNAQRIDAFHLDPDTLNWKSIIGVADVETVPALDNPASEPTICTHPILHADPSEYLQNRGPEGNV